MIPNSIRWNLQMWLAFLLICLLSSFGVAIYQLQYLNRFRHLDEELERRLALLSGDVRTSPPPNFAHGRPFKARGRDRMFRGGEPGRVPPEQGPDMGPSGRPPEPPPEWLSPREMPPEGFADFAGASPLITREICVSSDIALLFDEARTNSFYYVVWSPFDSIMKRSTNSTVELARPSDVRDTSTHIQMRGKLREAFLFTGWGECILVGKSVDEELASLHRFALWIFAAGSGILCLGLSVGWWLTVRALRPVEEISAAASRISSGSLSERIHTADPDNEIGRLAAVLNSTFARLELAFAQQKQFIADASHELRTPLAVIVSEAQTTLSRERSSAEYRETIEVCLASAQQMGQLTQSLLELARFDAGQENIRRVVFNLDAKVTECINLVEPLARERNIVVRRELADGDVFGDPERIRQVVLNLLSNAIHYNRDGGEIRVRLQVESGMAVLNISDTGCGIGPDDLAHVFERFYRADKARARSQGHCGLGLAICKTIIDAHGGNIELSSELGVGTTCTVRLPLQ